MKKNTSISGANNKTSETAKIRFAYRNKDFNEVFNVVDAENLKNILICNATGKKIETGRLAMPVECTINTKQEPQ